MPEPKITKEQAIKEVNAWLDFKMVKPNLRAKFEDSINDLVSAIEDGSMIMNPETKEITYNLMFPVGESSLKQLVFKPRGNTALFKQYGANEAKDTRSTICCKIAALTGVNAKLIEYIDHEDMRQIDHLIVFFV
jgi:hypothetical protein